jgi:ElaA protein
MHEAPTAQWQLSNFETLTVQALYEILQLRSEVFVVEQACAFQDLDGSDELALHLQGRVRAHLVAYARCFGPGAKYAEASVGRIVTHPSTRGSGFGHELVERAIRAVGERWGVQPIRIGAQAHLKGFYESHGFVDVGSPYVEDGIDHLEMLWQPDTRRRD